MKKWYLTTVAIVLLALVPVIVLSVPQIQAWVLSQALSRLASGGISVENPQMDLLAGTAAASRLVLRDGGATAPALFSIQGVDIVYSLKDLLLGDLQGVEINADAAQVYVSTTDGVSDPSPLEWLDYHRWLPDEIAVDAFHIIHQTSETRILYFTELWGKRGPDLSYQLQGALVFDNEKLSLDWTLEGLQVAEGIRRLQTEFDLLSNSGNRLYLRGQMEGSVDEFAYHLAMESQFQRIEDLPVELATGLDLHGSISLAGQVDGDQAGLKLTQASARILKGSQYQYQVTGEIDYPFDGPNTIALSVSGQLEDLEHLIDWVDIDLTDLGQASVDFNLTGSLEKPLLDGLTISTRNSNGLATSITGDMDFDTATLQLSSTNLQLSAEAPGLEPLTPWLGRSDIDTGPWRATGTLRYTGPDLLLEGLEFTLGQDFATTVNVDGSVQTNSQDSDNTAPYPVDLDIRFTLPEQELAKRLDIEPGSFDGALDGGFQLQSDAKLYRINALQINHEQSGLQIVGNGTWRDPSSINDLQLSGTLRQLSLNYLAKQLLPEKQLPALDGMLAGSFEFQGQDGQLDLQQFSVRSLDSSSVSLTVSGSAGDLLRDPTGQWTGALDLAAGPLSQQLSGVSLSRLRLTVDSQWQSHTLDSKFNGQLGSSEFAGDLVMRAQGGKIQKISGVLRSDDVVLADLGLQEFSAEETGSESYVPADHLKELAEKGYLGKLLRVSPPFDTDLTLELGRVWGETTRLDKLRLHITGADHRYMVRDLTLGYQGGLAELRGVIDLVGSPPYFSVAGDIRQLPMSTLTEDLGIETDVRGILSAQGGITSRGLDTGDLADSASGWLSVAAKDLVIRGAAYDVLATDFLAWLYRGMASRKSTHFHCAKAGFQLNTGVADSENLLIESSRMIAKGSANVDIPKGELLVRLLPQSRTRALQIPSQVSIKGKFEDPKVTTSPIAAVLDASMEFISLIPKVALKVLGIKRENYYSPCEP